MRARLTDDGLEASGGRVIGWEQMLCVHFTRGGAEVLTTSGSVRVDLETGLAVELRIAPWEVQRAAWARAQSVETRAGWLGLLPDARITVAPNRASTAVTLGCAAPMALAFGILLAGTGWNLLLLLYALGCAVSLVRMAIAARQEQVAWTLDVDGVTVGQQRIGWAEMRDCGELPAPLATGPSSALSLTSVLGDRWLSTTAGEQHLLRAALRRWHTEGRQAVPQPDGAAQQFAVLPGWSRLVVDDAGLWWVSRWRARLVPWRRIKAVRQQGALPELLLASGRRCSLAWVVGAKRLAAMIDQRLAGGEPMVDAQIERWLGVTPGGALVCRLSPWHGVGLVALPLLLLAIPWSGFTSGVGLIAGLAPSLALALLAVLSSARSVRADAQGLSVRRRGRREYYAWSEIERVTSTDRTHVISTTRGPVKLASSARGAGLVVGIIQRILDARSGGAALPDRAPMPETALSRLTDTEPPTDDRALSISER
ncbi:MAG: hypothetical protein HZB16_14850 [Armatimonadetes bacterium]|nr:hypothetical protein [Armatimonadota bacterium]